MAVTDMLAALQLKANLIGDDSVGLADIECDVRDRVALLSGEVETEDQRRIAEELALEVDGVDEVQNGIRVVPAAGEAAEPPEGTDAHLGYGPAEGSVGDTAFAIGGEITGPGSGMAASEQFPGQFTDDQIEQELARRLGSQNEVDISAVSVSSENQIVRLAGRVRTPEDANLLQDMVLNLRGVMGVANDLTVQEGEIGTPTE